MNYFLHINTALEHAWVGLSEGARTIAFRESSFQKEHGAFLQPAIKAISLEAGIPLADLAAVSVINGPGSYTGLRVGLSAAKGICFSLHKPLICLSTLEWLAIHFKGEPVDRICPMIDARRMEVFTASFDPAMKYLKPAENLIIDENSFPELANERIIFTGNGRNKLPDAIKFHPHAVLPEFEPGIPEQADMAYMAYQQQIFADLAYSEPFYLKSFFTPDKKSVS